ncbi:MAG: hypothetical protein AAGC55_15720 [Myxococcota bacterium]
MLRRCVLDPKGYTLGDAIEQWQPQQARLHAPSLDAFMNELDRLASQYEKTRARPRPSSE